MSQLIAIQQMETDAFDGWYEIPMKEAHALKAKWDAIYPNNTHKIIRSPTKDGFIITNKLVDITDIKDLEVTDLSSSVTLEVADVIMPIED